MPLSVLIKLLQRYPVGRSTNRETIFDSEASQTESIPFQTTPSVAAAIWCSAFGGSGSETLRDSFDRTL